MLNRRILRVKAFKTVYALAENPQISRKELESQFEKSCEATRDLYVYLLSIIAPLTSEALSRIESARSKFNPTPEELNPNMKFVRNSVASLFAEDEDFCRVIARKKYSWDQCDVFMRHLYERVREREYFRKYLESDQSSLQEDALLWAKIFGRELENDEELSDILEDANIHWTDDLPYALIWCVRTLTDIAEGGRWCLPELYQSEMPGNDAMDSDKSFAFGIIRKAYDNFSAYYQMISDCTPKWDRNRLCVTDLALIVCGLAESGCTGAVSPRIIINEYVEISKFYSTPDSRAFVNGVLDKLINKQ